MVERIGGRVSDRFASESVEERYVYSTIMHTYAWRYVETALIIDCACLGRCLCRLYHKVEARAYSSITLESNRVEWSGVALVGVLRC